MASLESLVAPWIQKTAGIMLKNKEDKKSRTLIVKRDQGSKPMKINVDIIFPDCT